MRIIRESTTVSDGFRMPAEFERHRQGISQAVKNQGDNAVLPEYSGQRGTLMVWYP